MRVIFSRIKMKPRQVIAVVIFIILAVVATMLSPSLVSKMINDGVSDSNTKLIIILAIVMAGLALLACVLNLVALRISSRISTSFCADLREEIFVKVQSFSAAEMDIFGTSSLTTRSTTDVSTIQNFLSSLFRIGISMPIMAVVGIVMCVATAGKVSSVLVIAIPILLIVLVLLIILASRYSVKLRRKIDDINRLSLETLEGVRVIRAFNKQDHEMERFGGVNDENAQISQKSTTVSSALFPTVNALFGIASVAAMVVGTSLIMKGSLEVGTLVAATQYINMILISIIMTANVVSMFPDAHACMTRVAEVLTTEVSIQDSNKQAQEKTCRATVEFRNVTFAYPGADEPVIKDISFVSGPGETTAIIGRTGSGKTTTVNLIPRLYDTLFGEVLVDGVNVKDYKLEELRDLIGYVPQKNVLFTGDVASNLNFGKENGTEEEWREAVHIACAADFVEKKEGDYHSSITQGGTNLSGGQRQRMAIARAVMKKPEIYIFDDSFSALDMRTDAQLRKNLKENMGDATMIVVAQRVNTIMDATRILVLEDGVVTGIGTHKELLKTCKLYREIAEIQLGEEEVKNEIARA